MDIIEILEKKYTSERMEAIFEINSVLTNPTLEDAIPRLEKAVLRYSNLDVVLHTLSRLKQQTNQESQRVDEQDENKN